MRSRIFHGSRIMKIYDADIRGSYAPPLARGFQSGLQLTQISHFPVQGFQGSLRLVVIKCLRRNEQRLKQLLRLRNRAQGSSDRVRVHGWCMIETGACCGNPIFSAFARLATRRWSVAFESSLRVGHKVYGRVSPLLSQYGWRLVL